MIWKPPLVIKCVRLDSLKFLIKNELNKPDNEYDPKLMRKYLDDFKEHYRGTQNDLFGNSH